MKTLRIVLIALVALAAGVVASAHAQTLLLTLDTANPQPGSQFGRSVAVGDVNGDGKADIAVGAISEDPGGNENQGRAYVFSGADGSLIFTLNTPNPGAGAVFGISVAVGDVNDDGKGDVAVGAYSEDVGGNQTQGRAYVFSGADASLLLTLDTPDPQAYQRFGYSVAMGDVNADGRADIAVGAISGWPRDDLPGWAYVFSGADGSLLFTLDMPNPQAEAKFGLRVAVGDVNGDGKADIAVSACWEDVGANDYQGRTYVFSGADGSLLLTLDIPNPQARTFFGRGLTVGDVNADGKVDIVVGADGEEVGGNQEQGRTYVFSGADGSLLFTLNTPNPQEDAHFGYGLAVGDVNGDGKGDMAVGAFGHEVAGNDRQGRVYVFSGADGSLLFTLDTPNPGASPPFGAHFGISVAVGDVNGDGKRDIAVGAYDEQVGDNFAQGRAYVFSPLGPVGGVATLPDVADSSGYNYIALAALAAAAVVALGAGTWYARRRWLR